jgi:hypothetical protein
MYQRGGRRAAFPRRGVLRALALAPLAVAGCAAARAERAEGAESQPDPPSGGAARKGGAPGQAVTAIRAHAVPAEAEPAFVFRAAASRPGDPR